MNEKLEINTDLVEARVKEYQAALKEWDAKIDQLTAEARIEFEKERDGFNSELAEAYGDYAEAKLSEYLARIEGTYHRMKAKYESSSDD
jgi:hypothetical protein